MAWTYLAESEESPKPWSPGSLQSPIVKTPDTLKPFSSPEWQEETCPSPRSGTMSKQSIKRTLPPPKLFMAASPAKTFPLRAAERAWKESEADYSSRSLGLSASYDRDSSSWRTSQRLLFEEQTELLANFASSGMTVAGAFYPLQMWARITKGNGGGVLPGDGRLWMTPKAGNCGMTARTTGRPLEKSTHLQAQVHQWRTPLASDAEKKGHGNLSHQVRWATPSAADAVGSHGGGQGRSLRTDIHNWKKQMFPTPRANCGNGAGVHGTGGLDLQTAIQKWPTPNRNPSRGLRSGDPNDKNRIRLEPPGGQLNPTWVEWLMGYPSEWTALEDWAMRWFQPKRAKLSKG